MTISTAIPRSTRIGIEIDPQRRTRARLRSIGTAVPEMFTTQDAAGELLAEAWNLKGAALARWRRIVAGTGIEQRHGVLPVHAVLPLTTAQRMAAFEQLAPPLAAQAAIQALVSAGVSADAVTDLIVVSCTGFSAPGLDVALTESLNLKPTVRRTMIGFMGCFGAISGLRTAVGACLANQHRDQPPVALMVCVELCSLHVRNDPGIQNQVAAALFADGAAAAVVTNGPTSDCRFTCDSEPNQCIGELTTGASLLLPHGREWMTWRVTDAGFAMTLTRDVPAALRDSLQSFVHESGEPQPRSFVVHPGGPGILHAVNEALNLRDGAGLVHSQSVLKRFGNMSSGTVLFVLQEAMRCGAALPAMMLAFGPGLTIESMSVTGAT